MNIRYVNHLREEIDFSRPPYILQNLDVFNYQWTKKSTNVIRNNGANTFSRESKKFPIKVAIKADDFPDAANYLFETFEKDVLAGKPGKLIVGEYYLICYITESSKTDCVIRQGFMRVELTVQADYPEWIKETTTSFSRFSDSTAEYLDFPFGYSIDYANELVNGIIKNPGFVASNFKLTIYGQISNPTLYIAEHEYSVDVDVETGEYLTIDSVKKTIVLTRKNGEQVNCFNKRSRDSYVFEKIPSGDNIYSSLNESIYFDITLLDERSEPKWI